MKLAHHIFHDNFKTIWDTITKFDMQVYQRYVTMSIDNSDNDVIDGVIRFRKR